MIFIKNRYYIIYYEVVQRGLQRSHTPSESKEKHHIIPESFFIHRSRPGPKGWLEGNPEDPKNIVFLTPREHVFCHKLLVKITQGKMKSKMQLAVWRMMNGKSGKFFSSKEYECSKKLFTEYMKTAQKEKKKGPLSEEHKSKLSKATKNIPKSEKTKENMKNAWKLRDRITKETTRELISAASKTFWSLEKSKIDQSIKRKQFLNDNPQELKKMVNKLNANQTCKYCGLKTNIGNIKRWHGSNCKLNNKI